ncbi:MAG: hypothetical protein ACM34K_15840, partial [Bacillota bacterium]
TGTKVKDDQKSTNTKIRDKEIGKTDDGKTIYKSSKGRKYYLNDNGKKVYIRKNSKVTSSNQSSGNK